MYKILLLGSGDFSRGVLEGILASEHQLVAFFPWEIRFKPDLKTRIKRRFIEDNISVLERYQIPLLQLQSANSPAFHEAVKELSPDIMMVAGWGEILKPDTIRLPKVACVNTHPSLLPRHRGADPIASVLRENESQTGVTFHDLTPEIDAGNILFQSALPIYAHDDYTSLARRIAYRAKETVGHALANVGQPGVPQTPEEASYFYRPKPEDYWLDWSLPAEKLRNLIRSAQGHYYRTRHGDMGLNITHSEFVDLHEPCTSPGLVLYKSGSRLLVSTGDSHKGLFVQASPFNNRLGEFGAKLYCLNKVKVGDRFV